jgi:hypothetical protein
MALRKIITVRDRMQKNYRYTLSARTGKDFDPRFLPELTPKQMLALGVFGGVYLRDCTKEFPRDWFAKAKLQKPGIYTRAAALNYFGINASQSLEMWRKKQWIYKDDPRGWFQWYCRYYLGRRGPDDERQITRWVAMRRHLSQVRNNCRPGDQYCRRKQRQALLHWAYDSRKI